MQQVYFYTQALTARSALFTEFSALLSKVPVDTLLQIYWNGSNSCNYLIIPDCPFVNMLAKFIIGYGTGATSDKKVCLENIL